MSCEGLTCTTATYMHSTPRLGLNDSCVHLIFGGTTEIQKEIIARSLGL